jgi:hypothetical protein
MLRKLRAFNALPGRDKGLLLAALALLPTLQLALYFLGYKRTVAYVQRPAAERVLPLPVRIARARRVAALVRAAARQQPIQARCLVQSLCLLQLMRITGLGNARLCIGIDTSRKVLEGHAWVELDAQLINDAPETVARYRPFELGDRPLAGL